MVTAHGVHWWRWGVSLRARIIRAALRRPDSSMHTSVSAVAVPTRIVLPDERHRPHAGAKGAGFGKHAGFAAGPAMTPTKVATLSGAESAQSS